MSTGEDARGPWNKGRGPWEKGEQWEYVEDPTAQVQESVGQANKEIVGHERDPKAMQALERKLGKERKAEVSLPIPKDGLAWSNYDEKADVTED